MPLSTLTGSFQLNTSTGNQSVTGLGFTPKLVIFFHTPDTVDTGQTANYEMMFGAAVSSSSRAVMNLQEANGKDTTEVYASQDATKCLKRNTTAGVAFQADLVSLDSDGFTINISTAPADVFRVGYMALGGDSLTNVKIGTFNHSTSGGDKAVTGVGFQPDALMIFGLNISAPSYSSTLGITDGTNSGCVGLYHQNGAATSDTARVVSATQVLHLMRSSASDWYATLKSMDADGFTLNYGFWRVNTVAAFYIALKGPGIKVGALAMPTSASDFSATGAGFKPQAGFFLSAGATTYDTITAGAISSFGMATADDEMYEIGGTDEDNQGVSDSDHHTSNDKVIQIGDYATNIVEDAAFKSWDADGFTLTSSVAVGANTSKIVYLIIEQTFDPGGGNGGSGSGGTDSRDSSFFFLLL